MDLRNDTDLGDWRRRAQSGARDIVVAVTLTVLALTLIGVAWLGNSGRHGAEPVASAPQIMPY